MEISELTVDTHASLTLPWEEMMLLPIGDIQHGAQGVDLPKLSRHIEWGVERGAYFTGLGDYIDVASPSGRSKWRRSEFYDSLIDSMDAHVHKLTDELKRVLEPSQGRWLMLNRGHHFWPYDSENSAFTDTDAELADFLGCPVTGDMGLGVVQIKFKNEKGKRAIKARIWQWHGEGSGQTMAAPLNKLEREMSRWPTIDIFLIGHYSRKVGYPVDCLVPVFGKRPDVKAVRRILACTGGWVQSYTVGSRPSYVERAGMPPTNLGGPVIYARPVHAAGGDRLDLSVSL